MKIDFDKWTQQKIDAAKKEDIDKLCKAALRVQHLVSSEGACCYNMSFQEFWADYGETVAAVFGWADTTEGDNT